MQFYPMHDGIRSLLWPMLVLVLLAGCDGAQDEQLIAADPVPRQGSVRFVNAIPDAPQITGALGASNLGAFDFGQASQLSKFLVGIYNFRFAYVTPAGDIVDVVPNERIELTQEDEVSLYLIGSWAAPTLVRIDNVEIDFGIVVGGTDHLQKAGVQVVHGSGDAGPVDVYLTELGADLATATPLASVAYGDVGDLETITPETDYQLRVTTAGTTDVLFDSGQFAIEGFTRQMFLIRDFFGPGDHDFTVSRVTSLGALPFPNETWDTELLFANYIADVPSVDVYLGSTATPPVYPATPAFADVAFGERTARPGPSSAQAPGPRTVKVTKAGTATVVLEKPTNLLAGTFETVFVGGLDTGDTTTLVATIDDIRPVATEARIRFDHASPAAGSVNVFILPPGQPTSDVTATFGTFAPNGRRTGFLLPGSYDVTVVRASNPSVTIAGPERISVEVGGLYTLALTDSPGGGEPILLVRQDDLAP